MNQSINVWQREAQSFSLATAANFNEEWTLSEIQSLEALRAAKVSIKDIAKKLGRSYYSVTNKLSTSGLSTPRNTTKPVQVVVCQGCFTTPSSSGVCYC